MNFQPDPNHVLTESIEGRINAALEQLQTQQKPRNYLGGSRLGLECHRALAYEWFEQQENLRRFEAGEPTINRFSGRVLRIFRLGHLLEDECAALLRLAGFDLRTEKQGGGQYGFKVAQGKIAGHIDGVFIDGPPEFGLQFPALWENKTMNAKKWKECNEKGVKVSHSIYYAQMNTYCAYMQLPRWVFTAYNKDTSELLVQTGELDAEAAQWASDRGVAVITAQRPEDLPRISRDENDWRCKWCDFKDTCRGTAAPNVENVGFRPAWL